MSPKLTQIKNGEYEEGDDTCSFRHWIGANHSRLDHNLNKVADMHEQIKTISIHTVHLGKLDSIAYEMKRAWVSNLLLTGTLCVLLVILVLGNKSFEITPSGLRIGLGQEK